MSASVAPWPSSATAAVWPRPGVSAMPPGMIPDSTSPPDDGRLPYLLPFLLGGAA